MNARCTAWTPLITLLAASALACSPKATPGGPRDASSCAETGGVCLSDSDCCSGEACSSGRCGTMTCSVAGHPCAVTSDCCPAQNLTCAAGVCEAGGDAGPCGAVGSGCASAADCCQVESLSCVEHFCNLSYCVGVGGYCRTTTDCCVPGEMCFNDICSSCSEAGGSCASDRDCCAGQCVSSQCGPSDGGTMGDAGDATDAG